MAREKRKTQIWRIQAVPLDQTANAERRTVPEAGGVQTKAIARITVHGPLAYVFARIGKIPYALIADEAHEVRLVQQLQYEDRILRMEFAQNEPRGNDVAHDFSRRGASPKAFASNA